MRAYQIITNNTCPDTDAEVLLVSILDYTMSISFCPQLSHVKIDDAVSIITCVVCKEH
jgi:hypothetical protein